MRQCEAELHAFSFDHLMPRQWGDEFARIALQLAKQTTLAGTLQAIVGQAVANVDGAEYAAITVKRGTDAWATVASSGDVPNLVDKIQYAADEGPCLTALRVGATTFSGDLGCDARWRVFGPAAVTQAGILSMLSDPLMIDENDILGALNLYSSKPAAFTENSVTTAVTLAAHSSVALARSADREQNAHLTAAVKSNRTIGMAIGILMHAHKITTDQAFDALRVASQHTHRKLLLVAQEVVDTGEVQLPRH